MGIEGCDRSLAAAAELVTPNLRIEFGVDGQIGEQDGDRLAHFLDPSSRFALLGRRRSRDLRVLAQDRPLQLLQLRACRLRAELLDQRGACGVVRLERVRLPARADKARA